MLGDLTISFALAPSATALSCPLCSMSIPVRANIFLSRDIMIVMFSDGETITYTPTKDEVALTEDIMNAWANFITSGNPNTGFALPVQYPAYTRYDI
jgi:hypothetical protein